MANILEGLVDATYVINLAHRTDRWAAVQAELAAVGWEKYERFDAYGVDHPPPARYTEGVAGFSMSGWWGNKLSHVGVIDAAKAAGHKSVAVFEDDVVLHPYFNNIVGQAMSQLAGTRMDWLQFGGNHRFFSPVEIDASPIDGMPYVCVEDGLAQVTTNASLILKMLTAHAYIAGRRTFDFILKYAIPSPLSIDGFYAHEVHKRFTCYCVTPCVASQRAGTNDIGGGHMDYQWYIGD